VLQLMRIETPTPRATLTRLRQNGLRGVMAGKRFVYDRADVEAYLSSRASDGLTSASQAALQLRLQARWLANEIRAGHLPGIVLADGRVLCVPGQVRQAIQAREAQERLGTAKRQRGGA